MLWKFFRKRTLAGSVWLLQSGSFPEPLTESQEAFYLERMKNGDDEARILIIKHNLWLVLSCLKQEINEKRIKLTVDYLKKVW